MSIFPVNINHKPADSSIRINCQDPSAASKIVSALSTFIPATVHRSYRVIICIGSDRSTGDALGPIVGTFLSSLKLPGTIVLGTLASPVHALNLESTVANLNLPDSHCPLVIAVDASLGKPNSIGTIEVGVGPLYPGSGVNKKLPPVGHLYLSGIVNIGGFMEQMVLQSTRLFQVMELAATIAAALQQFLIVGSQQQPGSAASQSGQFELLLWEALSTLKDG
ncbi:MAG TPA: spore protease YyaC [Firmicutes bacterium]|nr:spore protease YyaC [Bacillota bacterium]